MIEQAQYRIPATGEAWRDTRGSCYPSLFTIVGLSNHHETGEPLVVYCEANWTLGQLPPLHVLPLSFFLGVVPDLMASIDRAPRYRQRFEFHHDVGFDETCPFIREREKPFCVERDCPAISTTIQKPGTYQCPKCGKEWSVDR